MRPHIVLKIRKNSLLKKLFSKKLKNTQLNSMRDSAKELSIIQRFGFIFALSLVFVFIFACSEDKSDNTAGGTPRDPSQPIKLDKFYPDSGGIATKVIIKGSNFGTDIEKIKVYYNEKRAAIVQSNGNMIYIITPKQPGDTCLISVVVDQDSLTFNETFEYTTVTTVTTIAGKPGTTKIVDGTLAEAEFEHPRFLCVDAEKNIFVSEFRAHALRQINIEKNTVSTLFKDNGLTNPNAPSTDSYGKVVFVPTDAGNTIFEFDPERQWPGKKIAPIKAPDSKDFYIQYKHSAVPNMNDKMMYTRAHNGQLIKFDAVTKMGWLVTDGLEANCDSYLAFNTLDPDMLYISYSSFHCIGRYDLRTGKSEIFAGRVTGTGGYMDGDRKDAEFNDPRQICFDKDGNLYIADRGNQCIRKMNPEGIVTTVIGLPGIKGYVDGAPDVAQFNDPFGVAIDDDGTIYIADYENKCIRKLAIE